MKYLQLKDGNKSNFLLEVENISVDLVKSIGIKFQNIDSEKERREFIKQNFNINTPEDHVNTIYDKIYECFTKGYFIFNPKWLQ